MAKKLSDRTKKQNPGLIRPVTAALDSSDAVTASGQRFFFPHHGQTISAKDYGAALKKLAKKPKQETGDGQ